MRKEVDRVTQLVDSLVEMTRMEGDPGSRTLEELSLNAVLQEVVNDCEVEAAAHQAVIRCEAATPVTVEGDAELLRRAIENVLRNAIRYAPAGSEIAVKMESSGTEAAIVIRDQGSGVPEELLGKIFQAFFRVDDAREGSTGGIGLGLAIAARAVIVHHGTVTAENAHPGLRVRIQLPAVSEGEAKL